MTLKDAASDRQSENKKKGYIERHPGPAGLHGMGMGFSVRPRNFSHELGQPPFADPEQSLERRGDTFVYLTQSPLVRLKLMCHSGERISILCVSERLGLKGMRLMLPCRLDLNPGDTHDMELFLSPAGKPVSVTGTVQKVTRTGCEHAARYVVEVEFRKLSNQAKNEIATFLDASEMIERRQTLA